jgi:predicted ferric reductase
MISNISTFISGLFLSIVLLTIWIFYVTNNRSEKALLLIVLWGFLHSVLALNEFYVVEEIATFNPFVFILVPSFLIIFYSAFSKGGKQLFQNRNVFTSPVIHVVRIPVELFLHYLALQELVPKEMTFEGRNFDILVGLSAVIIVLLFRFFRLPKSLLLL